ncbi:unnamed protein product, partial [Symbiodinium sp. CCMP2456]
MPPSLALPHLDDVASRAGFDTEMIAYLSAKGITNAGLFFAPFFEPLRAGFDLAGNTVKRSDDERLILEAATRVALDELSVRRSQMLAASTPVLPPFQDDSRTKMILDDSGTFTKAMRHVPEPQKLVTLLDAVEAIKWGLMFSRWCDEHDASLWAEFWQKLCRDYPNKFPQTGAFFDKAFLHVSLQMRANKSFHEVLTWPKQDELNRPAPFDSSEPRQHVFLVENVVTTAALQAELDSLLDTTSFVVDAASFGLTSRTENNDTLQQWAAASRQYPPHQYRPQALVRVHGKWQTPDAATREWIQGFPQGITSPSDERISEHSRCKMLGNSWHLPSARFLLFVLLASCNVIPVTAGPVPEWYQPTAALPWSSNLNPLGPSEDTQQHLQWALALDASKLHFSQNNPVLEWALQSGHALGPDLSRWRKELVQDVALLREELQFEQDYWLASAPQHVQQVCRQGGNQFVLQPLVVLHLLTLFEFPGTKEVAEELQFGVKVLGPLTPGTGWDARRPSEHTATMLAEISKVAADSDARAARAFPVVQQDKVRRADDWR